MKLELKKSVIGVALARLVRFLLLIRRAACSHRFDPSSSSTGAPITNRPAGICIIVSRTPSPSSS